MRSSCISIPVISVSNLGFVMVSVVREVNT